MPIVVMGVSGSGKSCLGKLLAEHLRIEFVEGDDYHPQRNIEKMRISQPLEDEDRWPWLEILGNKLQQKPSIVVSCSALRQSYRDFLRQKANQPVIFLCLFGAKDILLQRLQERKGHYMPASLLDSQLDSFETPQGEDRVLMLPLEKSLAELTTRALNFIQQQEKFYEPS